MGKLFVLFVGIHEATFEEIEVKYIGG